MTISSVCALKLKGQEQLGKAQAYHGQYTKNKMARQSELLADAILEENIADIWHDYSVFMT